MKIILKSIPLYWKFFLGYLLITFFMTLLGNSAHKDIFSQVLMNRGIVLISLFLILFVNSKNQKYAYILYFLVCYVLLGNIYKETGLLNTLFFQKIDPYLSRMDAFIFGYQPSVEFSKKMNYPFFSELMFFGYFYYYLMPLIVFFSFLKNPQKIEEFGFFLIGSFMFYYLIYILIPAEGPQFYFDFPEKYIPTQGIFGKMVKTIQAFGEVPTAAFPSSHVGISTIVLLWLYRSKKKLFFILLTFSIILFFSTVYIKAHYFVDVLAGFISGIIIYFVNNFIFKILNAAS